MTENELIAHWTTARRHIILAQIAPTLLLTVTVWMLTAGLAQAELSVRLAATGILLASGVLGATAQIASAQEGRAIVADLQALGARSAVARTIVASRWGIEIVRVISPLIFVAVFAALLVALYL